jgi:type IV pilus assembly protein PilV
MYLKLDRTNLKQSSKAFALIEVLIAIVIFSLSMIALLAVEMESIASAQSAGYRNIASSMAYNLADQMRANATAVSSNSYTATIAVGGSAGTKNSCRSVYYNTTGTASQCTSAQMAQDDLYNFALNLKSQIPNANAFICRDSSITDGSVSSSSCDGNGNYVIKIFWNDSSNKKLGITTNHLILEVQP